MSAAVLPFPSPRYTTGEQIRIAKAYRQTHADLRRSVEEERFFREVWLPAFEEECRADPSFAVTMGMVL